MCHTFKKAWIPAAVYPCAGRNRNDINFFVTPGEDPGSISRAMRFECGLDSCLRRNDINYFCHPGCRDTVMINEIYVILSQAKHLIFCQVGEGRDPSAGASG